MSRGTQIFEYSIISCTHSGNSGRSGRLTWGVGSVTCGRLGTGRSTWGGVISGISQSGKNWESHSNSRERIGPRMITAIAQPALPMPSAMGISVRLTGLDCIMSLRRCPRESAGGSNSTTVGPSRNSICRMSLKRLTCTFKCGFSRSVPKPMNISSSSVAPFPYSGMRAAPSSMLSYWCWTSPLTNTWRRKGGLPRNSDRRCQGFASAAAR